MIHSTFAQYPPRRRCGLSILSFPEQCISCMLPFLTMGPNSAAVFHLYKYLLITSDYRDLIDGGFLPVSCCPHRQLFPCLFLLPAASHHFLLFTLRLQLHFSLITPHTPIVQVQNNRAMIASKPRLRGPSPGVDILPQAHTKDRAFLPADEKAETGKRILLSWNDIPEWYRDNEYIRHGYRPVSGSTRTSWASWLYMHNETLNIYTHLLPAVFFLGCEWYLLRYLHSKYENMTSTEDFIFTFFLLTAAVCLGLSTTYHTLLNHSPHAEIFWLRLDFSGIVLLTTGDFVSGVYMAFYCESVLRRVYWTMVRYPPPTTIGTNLYDCDCGI